MTTRSKMEKLLAARAMEFGSNKEPFFTIQFRNYISIFAGMNKDSLKLVDGWRRMLLTLSNELDRLKDEEISTIIRLLEYQQKSTRSFPIRV